MAKEITVAVLTEPRKIEIKKIPWPMLHENEILLKMEMCGVCGTDVHYYRGALHPSGATIYPIILGHEIVGTVEEVGKKANETMKITEGTLQKGDRVVVFGAITCDKCWGCRHFGNVNHLDCTARPPGPKGFQDYIVLPPNTLIWKIPDDVPFEVAVLADPLAIGVRAVDEILSLGTLSNNALLPYSGTVVIQGSGAVGVLAAAACRIAGAGKIIMTGSPASRLKIAEDLGVVDCTIDIKEVGLEERIKKVLEMTPGGYGADVVIEAAGAPEAFLEGLKMVRKGGTFIEMGNFLDVGRPVQLNVCRDLCYKDFNLHTIWAPSPRHFEKAINMLVNNRHRYHFEKLVTHKFKLVDVAKALETAAKEECLKAVIIG